MSAFIARTCLLVGAFAFVIACAPSNESAQNRAATGGLPPLHEYKTIDTLPTNDAASMAISPDGRQLAFVAQDGGRNRLWLQEIGTGATHVFPGTSEVRWLFWSPDGKNIGFFNNDQVWRVDVATGKTQVIVAAATWAAGGTWGPNGVILYGRHGAMSILSTSADGRSQGSATNYPIDGQLAHFHPFFLPDGRHFLYYVEGADEVRGIYVGSIDRAPGAPGLARLLDVLFHGEQGDQRLVEAQAGGVYALGRLFFVQGGTLLAQPFDTDTHRLSGSPEVVAKGIAIGGRNGAALSATGDHVIYRTGPAGSTQQLTWFNRSGKALGTVGEPFAGGAGAMSISPDGTRVVVNRYVDAHGDIFTVDLATGTATQVSDFPANSSYPIWSFDSKSVLFSSNLRVGYEVYRRVIGAAAAEEVFQTAGWRHPMDMSRDGRYLIYRMNTADLWALDMQTKAEIRFFHPGVSAQWPQISPNGRWFAYQSADSGSTEIYLHGPFDPPNLGQRSKPLSVGSGGWVRWRADGRELYYVDPGGSLMAVALTFDGNGKSFTAAAPVKLFAVPMNMGSINKSIGQQYMPDKSGERILVLAAMPEKSPVHVLGFLPE